MAKATGQRSEIGSKRWVRVNVRLIVGLTIGTVVFAAGVHLLHAFQYERNATQLHERAVAAHQQGETAQAIGLLSQYIRLRPTDTDALESLATWMEETSRSPKTWFRVFQTYEEVLRRDPTRRQTRRRAVDVALALRRYSDALEHLRVLRENEPDDGELLALEARCHEALGRAHEAARLYLRAVEADPPTIQHYQRLASLVRRRPQEMLRAEDVEESGLSADLANLFPSREAAFDAEQVADRVLELMVARGRPAYRARLVRAADRMRRRRYTEAAEDIAQALDEAGHETEVLLAAAELALARAAEARLEGDHEAADRFLDEVREYARAGLDADPPDLHFYLTLSRVAILEDKLDEAEAVLREGLRVLPRARSREEPSETEVADRFGALENQLRWSLADVLLTDPVSHEDRQKRIEEARGLISQLRAQAVYPPLLEFLEARILLTENQWHRAGLLLEKSRPYLRFVPTLWKRIDLYLGQCYDRLANPDAKLDVFRRALKEDPVWVTGRLHLASALVDLGRLDEAIEEYQAVIRVPGVAPALARLLIVLELDKPETQRRYENIERVLDYAAQHEPENAQVPMLRAEVLAMQGRFAQADAVLAQAQEVLPNEESLWSSRALLALRRTDWPQKQRIAEADRILHEAAGRFGDRAELRIARASVAAQRGDEAVRTAELEALANGLDAFPPDGQVKILQALAQVWDRLNDSARADAMWERAVAVEPDAFELRMIAAMRAVREESPSRFQRHLQHIRSLEGVDGPNGNYLEAVRLIEDVRADRQPRERLSQAYDQLTQAAEQRPFWAAVPRALGDLEALRGNLDEAYTHDRRAIALGNRARSVIGRAVRYLYEKKRFEEADRLLRTISEESPELLSGSLARLAWRVAWQRQQYDEAINTADDLAGQSRDYRDLVWLAQLRFARGIRGKDVEEPLKQAIEAAPEAATPWLALVTYYVRVGRSREAEQVLNEAVARLAADPPHLVPLTLARGYELLDDNDRAATEYRRAVAASPSDVGLRILIADFFTRTGQFEKAGEHLQWLTDPDHATPDFAVRWAQRRQAMIVAAGGGYNDTLRALQLLREARSRRGHVTPDDLRAEAAILAKRNTRRDKLDRIRIYQQIAEQQPLEPDEQFTLARLYEETGDWEQAREQMTALLREYGDRVLYVAWWAEALLRHEGPDEAELWVERARALDGETLTTTFLTARLLVARGRKTEAVTALRDFLNRQQPLGPDPATREQLRKLLLAGEEQLPRAVHVFGEYVKTTKDANARRVLASVQERLAESNPDAAYSQLRRFMESTDLAIGVHADRLRESGRLLEELGLADQAEQFYRRYVEVSVRPEAHLEMAAYLGRQGRIAEALDLCESLDGRVPQDRIAGMMVSLARRDAATEADRKRVETHLAEAVRSAPDDSRLLMHLAALRDLQGDYDEAARLFQAILQTDSRNVQALNNLAWLLAVHFGKPHEALPLIERAIEIAGPQPVLLDTRAEVHLALNDVQQAVDDLLEATAQMDVPEFRLHLANAYAKRGETERARAEFEEALRLGLDVSKLHPLDRPTYERLQAMLAVAAG